MAAKRKISSDVEPATGTHPPSSATESSRGDAEGTPGEGLPSEGVAAERLAPESEPAPSVPAGAAPAAASVATPVAVSATTSASASVPGPVAGDARARARLGAGGVAPPRLPLVSEGPRAGVVVGERADAARNRAAILAAARRLLAQRPMRDIAMDELAREACVGKGTLYRRFTDRTSLCLALLDENERTLQDQALRQFGLPPLAPPGERLSALLDALLAFALDNAELLREAEASSDPGGLLESGVYRWRRNAIVRLAQQCRAQGSPTPVDPELAADAILVAMGGAILARAEARATSDDELRRRYRELFRALLPCLGEPRVAEPEEGAVKAP